MKRAGFAQLGAVVLAFVLVLGAGGYGIARGLTSDADNNVAPPPRGFRIIPQGHGDFSWDVAVPDSPVPKGTRPRIWIVEYVQFSRNKECVTVRIQVDGPDGHTVSSINSNFAVGHSQLIPIVTEPLNTSGRYVATVFVPFGG